MVYLVAGIALVIGMAWLLVQVTRIFDEASAALGG